MGIKRKFLVKDISPLDLNKYRKATIEQYYVSFCPEIRLRYKNFENEIICFPSIKGDGIFVSSET